MQPNRNEQDILEIISYDQMIISLVTCMMNEEYDLFVELLAEATQDQAESGKLIITLLEKVCHTVHERAGFSNRTPQEVLRGWAQLDASILEDPSLFDK